MSVEELGQLKPITKLCPGSGKPVRETWDYLDRPLNVCSRCSLEPPIGATVMDEHATLDWQAMIARGDFG